MSSPIIGRVLITQKERAEPFRFFAWLIDPSLEIGQFLIAENSTGEDKILVMIESIEHTSSVPSHIEAFFGHSYGDPTQKPATRPPTIRIANLMVLSRTLATLAPPGESYAIKRPTDVDLELLASAIPSYRKVIGGLLKINSDISNPNSWSPVFFDSNLLLGPESGHVNISGISGMATKSSYAMFLIYSLIEWSRRNKEKLAVVVFNVKAQDFLSIHNLPESNENFTCLISDWGERRSSAKLADQNAAMWMKLLQYNLNPIEQVPEIKYFTYESDQDTNLMDSPEFYSYGLQDVSYIDLLSSLFSYDEVSSTPQEQLLQDYLDHHNSSSFNGFLTHLRAAGTDVGANRRSVGRGTGTFTSSTIRVLLNRINWFLSKSNHIVERINSQGNPIRADDLISGINVIQLNRLTDDEMRLVGNAVIRELFTNMESQERLFSRVIVFFDELNKFAPRRSLSPVKRQIIDIVARGRAMNFTLIGAEQFATQVDSEIFGNSVTKIIGYSEFSEIQDTIYRPLGKLKNLVPYLNKGQMIMRHPVYPSPLIIYFPLPPHMVTQN